MNSKEVLLTDFLGEVRVFCVLCAPSVPCACTLAAEVCLYLCESEALSTGSFAVTCGVRQHIKQQVHDFCHFEIVPNCRQFLYPSLLGAVFYR